MKIRDNNINKKRRKAEIIKKRIRLHGKNKDKLFKKQCK